MAYNVPRPKVKKEDLIPKQSKNNKQLIEEPKINDNNQLSFSLKQFKIGSINIKNEFNNHFRSPAEAKKYFIDILQLLVDISNYKTSDFSNGRFIDQKHLHKIGNEQLEILKKVLREYQYNEFFIDDLVAGERVYQISKSKSGGRLIFELVGSVIYPLFIDPNHHIYSNDRFIKETYSYKYNFAQ